MFTTSLPLNDIVNNIVELLLLNIVDTDNNSCGFANFIYGYIILLAQ